MGDSRDWARTKCLTFRNHFRSYISRKWVGDMTTLDFISVSRTMFNFFYPALISVFPSPVQHGGSALLTSGQLRHRVRSDQRRHGVLHRAQGHRLYPQSFWWVSAQKQTGWKIPLFWHFCETKRKLHQTQWKQLNNPTIFKCIRFSEHQHFSRGNRRKSQIIKPPGGPSCAVGQVFIILWILKKIISVFCFV